MGGRPGTTHVPSLATRDKVTPSDAPYKRVCLRGGKSPVPASFAADTKDGAATGDGATCFECLENLDFFIRDFLPKVLYDESYDRPGKRGGPRAGQPEDAPVGVGGPIVWCRGLGFSRPAAT